MLEFLFTLTIPLLTIVLPIVLTHHSMRSVKKQHERFLSHFDKEESLNTPEVAFYAFSKEQITELTAIVQTSKPRPVDGARRANSV